MKPDSVYMITGAAKGIGAATAEYVVSCGGRVVLCDIDEETCRETAERLGKATFVVPLDVTDAEAWEQAAGKAWSIFGRVDVLVNNAGLAIGGLCHEIDPTRLKAVVDVNLLGPIYGMHATVPRFLEQGFGHIVNIGSFASFSPMFGLGIYSATKHGLRAYTHSADFELADTPVGVSLVCPSAVETPMMEELGKDDNALIVFNETPMPAMKIAEAIIRAAEEKRHEILLPPMKGALLRFVGLFPGLLKKSMPAALKKGKSTLELRKKTMAARS